MLVRGESVRRYVFGRSRFEYRLSFRLQPRMAGNCSGRVVSHSKDDSRGCSALRKIAMQHRGAFPTDRFEHPYVCRQQEIDSARQSLVIGRISQRWSIRLPPGNDLKRTRQRISSRRNRQNPDPPRHPAQQQRLTWLLHNLAPGAIDQIRGFSQTLQSNLNSSSFEFSHLNG